MHIAWFKTTIQHTIEANLSKLAHIFYAKNIQTLLRCHRATLVILICQRTLRMAEITSNYRRFSRFSLFLFVQLQSAQHVAIQPKNWKFENQQQNELRHNEKKPKRKTNHNGH